jgi:hypothetical protein
MMCFHVVAIPPWSHFPKTKVRYTFEVVMLKRFIALAAASSAVALAASFYARVPTVQTGAEVEPMGVLAVTPSDVLTPSVTDVDGGVINGGPARFGESPTQVRKLQNPSDDDYIAYRHVFAHIYSEEHGKEKPNQNVNSAVEFFKHSVPLSEDEASDLAEIALETESHTLAIEGQAGTIVRRFREKIDAEMKSGRKPSPEPPELQMLQKQRVRTTLQGRDELRKAFGESTFSRFDKFLKEGMNLTIEKAIPSPQDN